MQSAGIVFPVSTVGHILSVYARRSCDQNATIFLTATLEYLAAELLELGGNKALEAPSNFDGPWGMGQPMGGGPPPMLGRGAGK